MKYTRKQFDAEFPNDAACLERLMLVNYGGTEITCPACSATDAKFHPMHTRKAYACQECGHHIYPCAGTIFHKSRTPLTMWFFAMYLMTSTRSGVAAKELERALGVTYKTAWRIAHQLRKLMASADHAGPLGGEGKHVEMDETYFGGRQSRKEHREKGTNKTIIFGMAERDGMLRAGPVRTNWLTTIEPIVRENVKPGTIVSTDEHGGYNDLHYLGMQHGTVAHSKKEYVRYDHTFPDGKLKTIAHHTNTIESHWGHFKRSVAGTHVTVSEKHLWKYIAEFTYRRNYRGSHSQMFNRLVAAFALPCPAAT